MARVGISRSRGMDILLAHGANAGRSAFDLGDQTKTSPSQGLGKITNGRGSGNPAMEFREGHCPLGSGYLPPHIDQNLV